MTASQRQPVEHVRLKIGAICYALPVASVAAILDLSTVERAASHDGSLWVGAIRSQQSMIRVADGGRVFGSARQEHPNMNARIVIFRSALPVGMTVDEVLGSRQYAPSDIIQIPETAGSRRQLLVSAVAWAGGDVDLVIDLPTVIQALGENQVDLDPAAIPRTRMGFDGPGDDVLEVQIPGNPDRWGLPISAVRHVAGYRRPQPLARAARDVAGLLAWQRQPIPLISVASRLGLEIEPRDEGQIVVIGEPAGVSGTDSPAVAALHVQGVIGLRSIERREGDLLSTTDGATLRRLDLTRLLNGDYLAESRATVLVSEPIPAISMTT